MVEFALVLPVFLLIVVGLLQFGRGLYYWITTNHVANESARWAAVDRAPDTTGATQSDRLQRYACSQASTRELQEGMSVTVDFSKAGSAYTTSSAGLAIGDSVRVRIVRQFNIGFWDMLPGSITLRGTSVMRVERLGGPGGTTLSTYDGATRVCP